MTVLASIFGGSLLLLSGLFAFKDWERQRGADTRFTLLLKRYSPGFEHLFRSAVARVTHAGLTAFTTLRAVIRFGFHRVLTLVRTGVVVFAAHMIRAARGENLMAEGKIPSTYFKLLRRHKDKLSGTDIPDGIVRQGIPQRVKVRVVTDSMPPSGTSLEPQVE